MQKIPNRRKLRNFLLLPLLQVKLGLYSTLVGVVFSGILFLTFYLGFRDFSEIIGFLSEKDSAVLPLFLNYVKQMELWIIFLSVLFLLVNLILSIVYTHRMVGPIVAFKHHIQRLQNGDYSRRIALRNGDAFQDLAHELNLLTEVLVRHQNTEDGSKV
jgi:signal transduction histidine kinase